MRSQGLVASLLVASLAGCGADSEGRDGHSSALVELISAELLREANHGRDVLRADGTFAFPEGVTRVWVDVGAHHLDTTLRPVQKNPDLALVAVEPLPEAWRGWPDSERILAIPAALDRQRGFMDFHVNRSLGTSSLLPSDPGKPLLPLADIATKTLEVRKVPVLLLEDVLERIPAEIDVEFVKTDVQGVDLQVLKSGGEQLRRAWRIKTEIIVHNEGVYAGEGADEPGSEEDFDRYMESVGFEFVQDRNIAPKRMWLDKEYVNAELALRDPRIRAPNRDLEWSLEK
jgi:FkbM family methyltransferase